MRVGGKWRYLWRAIDAKGQMHPGTTSATAPSVIE
ncbi:hypothetical protein [Roseovarius sp. THAF8]|nr:hypothetical protein [Roseovarius sp. THAF8]